jgi:capsular exopolysaccharide synthesis family protein
MPTHTDYPLAGSRAGEAAQRDQRGRLQAALSVLPAGDGHTPAAPAAAGGIDVGMLLRTLWSRLYIVIALAVLGAVLGSLAQAKIKPRFTSSVSLLLDPKRSDSFGADGQFGNAYVDASKIASVASVIESSDLLARVVAKLHLGDDPEFGDPVPPRLSSWFGFLPFVTTPAVFDSPGAREERALARLEQAVRVDRVGVTYVLTIDVNASRPQTAQAVAAAVADAYLEDQITSKAATVERGTTWLAAKLSEAHNELVSSEEAVEAIRRTYALPEVDRGPGVTSEQQTLTELNTQLAQAQADIPARKARYEQAERLRAAGKSLEGLPEVSGSHLIEDLRKAQADVAQKLAEFTTRYNENFPDVVKLRDYQAALQRQLDAEVARIVDGLRNEYETAVAREAGLREQLQQLAATESSVSRSDGRIQLRDAQRAVEEKRGQYDALFTRWRNVQQQQTWEDPEARIISQAALPDRPSWPKPFLLPGGGLAMFGLVGLGLVLTPSLLEKRFVSVNDVERRLGLLVLAGIPLLRRRDLAAARGTVDIRDYPARKPLSRFAESLRMLRAHLRIATDGAPSIIQVTSAVPAEGKSTVAAALAVSAALAGMRTVLVDVDLRSSSLSEMFGLRYEEGLTDILESGVAVRAVVRRFEDPPLAVIGAGSALIPRPDVVDSVRFGNMLRELSESYNLVILDSPPVLPVTDALVISKHAHATILVVQWRATARLLVEQAVKVLRTVNAPLVGVMLNKINLAKVSQYGPSSQYVYGARKSADGT